MKPNNNLRRPNFEPQENDPCFCNRGKLFKDCCGSLSPNREPPAGVAIIPNFINAEKCDDWVRRAELKNREWLKVVRGDVNRKTGKIRRELDPGRVTEKVDLEEIEKEMNAEITYALKAKVEPYYRKKIAWFEGASLLRYSPGGKYLGHADSDSWDPKSARWYKSLDRSVSLLIYLNDNYTGGALHFTRFNYRYQPSKGDLLFFLSDHRYMHEAEMVKSGIRYAMVSWAAFSNISRVFKKHRPTNWIVLDPNGD